MKTHRVGRRRPGAALAFAAVLLGALVTGPPAWAPAPEKPEKIKAGPVKSEPGRLMLVIDVAARPGVAEAGEQAGWAIAITLKVAAADGRVANLPTTIHAVAHDPDAAPRDDGFVPLEPLLVHWDREGGTFGPLVTVFVTAELRNTAGRTIATAEHEERDLDLDEEGRTG